MAFFSSSHAYDTPVHRKRSTSTTRERKDSPTDQSPHSRDLSPVMFANPDASGYDQSSTPSLFKNSISHNLPPHLILDASDIPSSSQSSSSTSAAPAKHREHRSPPKTRVAASSSPCPRSARFKARPQFSPAEVNVNRRTFLDMSAKKMPDASFQPSWLLSQAPSSNGRSSPTAEPRPLPTLSTPISPPQHRTTKRADPTTPLATPPGHARSRSQVDLQERGAPDFALAPTQGSTASSTRRTPVPLNIFPFDSDSGSGSESWSESDNSTPTVNAMQQLKHPRNVLRKPSTTSRRRGAASAATSDGERKAHTQTEAGAAHSFASGRSSSAAQLDVAPILAKDLTPAGEVIVAYKESQHRCVSDTMFVSSGKVVAIGSPDDDALGASRSPWTAGWRTKSNQEGADERGGGEGKGGGLRKSLGRKFSTRGAGKNAEQPGPRPPEESPRPSEPALAVDISRRKAGQHTVGKRSATFPKYTRAEVSPTRGGDAEQWPEQEGRVWEEEVGDWMDLRSRGRDDLDTDASSSRGLWKIVKRFGGSSLKEKYNPLLEARPPTPPLPRDVLQDRTGDAEGDADSSAPTNRGTKLGVAHTRRRATTVSSSPASGTGFFPRSRASSASSFGDMSFPPVPDTQIGQYIVPPHRGYRNSNSEEGSQASESPSGALFATNERPLPSPTASIPAFEAQDPVNSFSSFKHKHAHLPHATHFPEPELSTPRREQARWGLPPPPRTHRRPNLSAPAFPPPRQHSVPDITLVQGARVDVASENRWGSDSKQASVARPRSTSDAANPVVSTLRYREMSETQRRLTEQEKNAKWEDLLQRSDRAGGTLRVGSPTTGTLSLWSDRTSVASSEGS